MRAAFVFLVLSPLLTGCAMLLVHERTWFEARTDHFVVWSAVDEAETRELARNLELFRSVAAFATGADIPESPVPTHVFAFDGRSMFLPFRPGPGVLAYFLPGMRNSSLVFYDPGGDATRRRSMQHEYVHFLLHNHGSFVYPPWYDEGFAQFLATVDVEGEHVVIGGFPPDAAAALRGNRWVSFEEVLARRDLRGLGSWRVGMFYAESFAFVHYLSLGREERAETPAQLGRYLRRLERGTPNEEALRAAFGAGADELGERLREYLKRGRIQIARVGVDRFDRGSEPRIRRMPSSFVAERLGWLAWSLGRKRLAERYFVAALDDDAGSSRAVAGLAWVAASQGRHADAEARFEAALELDPEDALNHLDLGMYLHGLAEETTDPEARAQRIAEARQHYVRSWKLDDSIPETYARYGVSYLVEGEDPAGGLATLEKAERMLPSSVETKVLLGRLYLALGRDEDARRVLLAASSWNKSEQSDEQIEQLLAEAGAPPLPPE